MASPSANGSSVPEFLPSEKNESVTESDKAQESDDENHKLVDIVDKFVSERDDHGPKASEKYIDVAANDDDAPKNKATRVLEGHNEMHVTYKDRIGYSCFVELFASFRTLISTTMHVDTVAVVIIAAVATSLLFFLSPHGDVISARLDFTIISTSLIFPVTFLIQAGFQRRENALVSLSLIKSASVQIFISLIVWNWREEKDFAVIRFRDLREEIIFEKRVIKTMLESLRIMKAILSLPISTKQAYFYTNTGTQYRKRLLQQEGQLMEDLLLNFLELHYFIELLKEKGFSTSEASRSQQFIYQLQTEFEKMKAIKHFGTPQSAQAFLRVFVYVIPIMFSPYFTWVALPENAGITFAVLLSMLTAYILIALIDLQRTLQDPFTSVSIDGKKLTDEFDRMKNRIIYIRGRNNLRRKKMLMGQGNFSFVDKDVSSSDLESANGEMMTEATKA